MVIPSAQKLVKSSSAFFVAIPTPLASDVAEINGAAASMSMAIAARELLRRPATARRAANQARSISRSICRASSASSATAERNTGTQASIAQGVSARSAVVDLPHALQRRDNEIKALTLVDFTELYPLRFQCTAYCPFIASV